MQKLVESGKWWTDSWNPTVGCGDKLFSPQCLNCYACQLHTMRHKLYLTGCKMPKQYAKPFSEIQLFPERLEKPLHWRNPRIIFVDSMSDLFHSDVPFEFIDKVMAVIALCPQHTFLVLTKRIERMAEYFESRKHLSPIIQEAQKISGISALGITNPMPNLHLGCTPTEPEDIEILLQIPAAHHFISVEPLLEEWNLDSLTGHHSCIDSLRGNRSDSDSNGNIATSRCNILDGVIVGAETGANARYCPLKWIEGVVQQGKVAGVKVWVKAVHIGTPKKFKIIHKFNELPESVRVREL